MQGVPQSQRFGSLDVGVGAVGFHEPVLVAVKAALFEGGVGGLTSGERGFREHELERH